MGEAPLQSVEVVVALREHERRSPRVHRLKDVRANALIARVIVHQLLIERLKLHPLVRVGCARRLERRWLHEGEVLKRPSSRLHSRIHAVPYRPTLHEDDRVVPVFPRHRGRQPEHEPRLRLSRDLFEAMGRQVVALVNNHVTVAGYTVVDDALLDQALNHRDVQEPCRRITAATDTSNRLDRNTEEGRQALHPLVEQLTTMDEHERADATLCDQPGAHDRLPECGGGCQHTGVVREDGVRRDLLVAPQFPVEGHIQRSTVVAFVSNGRANPKVLQRVSQLVETATGKTNVMEVVLGAGDDARLVVDGQPH